MRTLEISTRREMSPSVRDISRYRRIPKVQVIELPRRQRVNVIQKVKFLGVTVFASFLLLMAVSEGVRTGLRHSGGNAEASGDFIVPRISASSTRINQPAMYQARPVDPVGMLREENRNRVDMVRERNRFITNLLGFTERTASRLGR